MVQQTHGAFHSTSHKPLTTAHLAHTMSLLRLNTEELKQKIDSELASNPALEFIEERRCPTCQKRLNGRMACPRCSVRRDQNDEQPIVFVSPPQATGPVSGSGKRPYEEYSDNEFSAQTEDLPTFILSQISADLEEYQQPIAAHILTSIDEDGFLGIPISEIAVYHHIGFDEIEEVLNLVQQAEPIGVGSADAKSAMLVQLAALGDKVPFPEATRTIVSDGLDLLSKKQYSELARLSGLTVGQVKSTAEFISQNLNPFPGRAHWGNARHHTEAAPSTYKNPDVIIRTQNSSEDSRLIIEVLWPVRGVLRVNPLFKKAIKNAPGEKKAEWKEDIEQANLLVKCLGQRYHTLVRLMEKLAVIQRNFILKGDANIRPITRAKIAEELDVHEATVSRAVAGKNVQLPNGKIVPISQFFDRSLHIRTALKDIVQNEATPLSDTKIAKILAEEGHKIARRTVAKYRSMEGILPAHLREGSAA